jgi:hypothetical protein
MTGFAYDKRLVTRNMLPIKKVAQEAGFYAASFRAISMAPSPIDGATRLAPRLKRFPL